ncbi:MAG: HAD-IB family phosphatase [Bacteroidota bacterium]
MEAPTTIKLSGTVIFDFDLTLIPHESLLEVLRIALCESQNLPLLERLQTSHALRSNKLSHSYTSFSDHIKALASIRMQHIADYFLDIIPTLDPKLLWLISELQAKGAKVCLISKSYWEWVAPIAQYWGISSDHVWANRFYWYQNRIVGPRPSPLLLGEQGKTKLVRRLKRAEALPRPIVMVGDGQADLNVFLSGQADAFIQACYFRETPLAKPARPANWYQARTISQASGLTLDLLQGQFRMEGILG